MDYIIGKKYSFKVVRSRRTLSIVSDGFNSYEYYGELLEGAEVVFSKKGNKVIVEDKSMNTKHSILPGYLLNGKLLKRQIWI